MERTLRSLLLASIFVGSSSSATAGTPKKPKEMPKIVKGEEIVVPYLDYVRRVDPEPSEFLGHMCTLPPKSRLAVVGVRGDRVLLRYHREATGNSFGCPDKMLFFLSKDGYLLRRKQSRDRQRMLMEEKRLVKELLSEEHAP